MKQIFEILQEERDRILNIHESATKNQYLNLMLEFNPDSEKVPKLDVNKVVATNKDYSSYTVKSDSVSFENAQKFANPQLTIYKGAKFVPVGDGKLVANTKFNFKNDFGSVTEGPDDGAGVEDNYIAYFTKKGNVTYYCGVGKYKVSNKISGYEYYAEDGSSPEVTKELNKVCAYKAPQKDASSSGPKSNENKYTSGKTNYQHKLKASWGDIIIPKGVSIVPNQEKNGVSIKTQKGNWVWFNCKKGVFSFNNSEVTPYNDALKNSLKQNYCKKGEETQTDNGNTSQGSVGGNVGGTTVVKPSETALDAILQKISGVTTPKPEDKQGPQTFIG